MLMVRTFEGWQALSVGCALGLLVAGCQPAESTQTGESTLGRSSAPLDLSQLAARLGAPRKAAIAVLEDGYRVRAGRGLAVDVDASGNTLQLTAGSSLLRVRRSGAEGGVVVAEGDVLRQRSALGSSALFFALDEEVEELIRVPEPRTQVGYDFELGATWSVRERPGAPPTLELSEGGAPRLQVSFAKAWDADGQQWPVQLELRGSQARFSLPDAAHFPVVIDPTWSRMPNKLTRERFRHTATLLLDGRLLLVGGATEAGGRDLPPDPDGTPQNQQLARAPTPTVELFDPVTGSFTEGPPLAHARWGHTATLLRDGRVLIAGGVGKDDEVLATSELFDPTTNSFVAGATLNQPRALHTATLLADDRVLILGGLRDVSTLYRRGQELTVQDSPYFSVKKAIVTHAEAYSAEPERFVDLGVAPRASFPHAAVLSADGRVACAWAQVPTTPVGQGVVALQWFDPKQNTFSKESEIHTGLPGSVGDLFLHLEQEPPPAAAGELGLRVVLYNAEFASDGTRVGLDTPPATYFTVGNSGMSAAMSFDAGSGKPVIVGGLLNFAFVSSTTTLRYQPCQDPTCAFHWSNADEELRRARAWPTATAMVDGRLLTLGGLGGSNAPLGSAEQSLPEVVISDAAVWDTAEEGHATTLLGDGSVLLSGGVKSDVITTRPPVAAGDEDRVDHMRATARSGHQSFRLPPGPGERVLLAGGTTTPADANEELFDLTTHTPQNLGFRLRARESGLALSRNRYLFAHSTGLELVDGADWGAGAQPIVLPKPLDCPAPRLARLLNGHVAVVGRDAIFDLDQDLKFGAPVPLQTPRCDPAVTALPDGTLAVIGGSSPSSEEASTAFEIYDPHKPATSARSLETTVVGARALVRFGELWLIGRDTQSAIDWLTGAEKSVLKGPWAPAQSVTTLADGSILRASHKSADPSSPGAVLSKRFELAATDASELQFAGAPLEVRPGDEVPLSGLRLSKTWRENHGGTTNSSATNAPIALWMPVLDGWPVTGTLTSWSEDHATWRVPHPGFPGLGTFGYVLSGTWHPLRLVEIKELDVARPCANGSECASGSCADGVCCDQACDGACQACTAALKVDGPDGTCGPARADATPDAACVVAPPCGFNGLCDGQGQCALFPDGESCGNGARCQSGACEQNTSCSTTADCTEGFVCNAEHQCHAPLSVPRTSVGCGPGCRLAAREPNAIGIAGLGISLALVTARRRSRRRRRWLELNRRRTR
jgi:Galactose oxidase, central domain